jgi:hypothetical protein
VPEKENKSQVFHEERNGKKVSMYLLEKERAIS